MGLLGFIGETVGATIKVVTTPIAVAKDVVNVAIGEDPTATEKHIKSIGKNIEKSIDEITGEL